MTRLLHFFKALFLCILIHHATPAMAQTSSVTGTFQDPNAQVFANGTYAINFKDAPGATGPSTQGGSTFTKNFSGSLDGTGSLSVTLTRNDFIQPSGSKWTFTVCPNSSAGCTTTDISITSASVSISSTLNALIPTIKVYAVSPMATAYSDSEIAITPAIGATYFNVTTQSVRQWNGSTWQNLASSNPIICGQYRGSTVTTLGTNLPTTVFSCTVNNIQAGKGIRITASFTNASGTNPIGYNVFFGGVGGVGFSCSAVFNGLCKVVVEFGNASGTQNSQSASYTAFNNNGSIATTVLNISGNTANPFQILVTVNDNGVGALSVNPQAFIVETLAN